MAIFRCKMCGGALEIQDTQSIATCEYCGTQQTLPRLVDDRKTNLYDRASHFRRNNDFDKAMAIYEQILNEDNTDAESYWSILLCRYGIEYVEDPTTRKRVPTVNRAQFTSIFDDENYKSAIRYADAYQKSIYESEATTINDIQKGILAISQKEKPFDVFICYKETDANGRRTQDSVLATELYQELVREGFKVFFSRITLEDKLGIAYEPYIFAALNSAKVMVVLGTRPEYFNAVWVKNEWSRYLALIKGGAKKMLIPAYRDMDPYNLPEEFSHLQAQDMSKLGFMQDLTRGIKKIIGSDAPKPVKETVVTTVNGVNVAPMLKRIALFLEDGLFDRADDLCEQVLNQDPENAQAYLYKMMIGFGIKKQQDLANGDILLDTDPNYAKVVRFADETLKNEVVGYMNAVSSRIEERRKSAQYDECMAYVSSLKTEDDYINLAKMLTEVGNYKDSMLLAQKYYNMGSQMKEERLYKIYSDAVAQMNSSNMEIEYPLRMAAIKFKSIEDYRDSKILYQRCVEMSEIAKRNQKYNELCAKLNNPNTFKRDYLRGYNKIISELEAIRDGFKELNGWRDSEDKIKFIKAKMIEFEEARKQEFINKAIEKENAEKKAKKICIISVAAVIGLIILIIFLSPAIRKSRYNKAIGLMENGEYAEAYDIFADLKKYNNSVVYSLDCAFLSGKQDLVSSIISNNAISEVTIPDGVTRINDSTFYNCSTITSVYIPDSVISIGDYAFYNCTNLELIDFSENIVSIGNHAFDSCSKLERVSLPSGVKKIGDYAFNCCRKINSVTLSQSLEYIGSYAFYDCESLKSITIPASVTQIGKYAFAYCSSLNRMTFSDTSTWYNTSFESSWNNKSGGNFHSISASYTNADNFSSSYSYYGYYWYKK